MENASYAGVRIESPKYNTGKGLGVLTLLFFGTFVSCVIIGFFGPEVFHRSNVTEESETLNVTWFGHVEDMERWHQLLFLHMRLLRPGTDEGDDTALVYSQDYKVSSWGSDEVFETPLCPYGCPDCDTYNGQQQCDVLSAELSNRRQIRCEAGRPWCEWTTLLTQDFVEYHTYYMKVNIDEPSLFSKDSIFYLEFEIVFVNEQFTRFEMAAFYGFLAITLCFMFLPKLGLFTEMMKLNKSLWSRQQKWVGALLVALAFFNNPFFAAQIYSGAPRLFFDLYVVSMTTFICLMLAFWLEIFSDMSKGEMQGTDHASIMARNREKAFRDYAPKAVLIFLLWLMTTITYIYVRVQRTNDPSYSSYDDLSQFALGKVLGIILATIYFAWLLFYIVLALGHIHKLLPSYRFLLGITMVTVVSTVAGLYMGGLAPNQHGSASFMFFTGLYNAYVLLLAYCYTPADQAYGSLGNGEMELATNGDIDDIPEMGAEGDAVFTIADDDDPKAGKR